MPRPALPSLAAVLLLASAAGAVDPSYWTHTDADDWAGATRDGTTVTDLGEVVLAGGFEVLADLGPDAPVVNALATAEGGIFAATGPNGRFVRIALDGPTVFVPLVGVDNILSVSANASLVGADGRVLKQPGSRPVFEADGVRYVWQIVGDLIAVGGSAAGVFRLDGEDATQLLRLDSQANATALAVGEDGTIYAGTSPGGQVWAVDPDGGEPRLLFDSPEPEITALLVRGEALYALAASQGEPAEEEAGAGRTAEVEVEIEVAEDEAEAPELPEVEPAEPDPIPMQEADDDAEEMPNDDADPVEEAVEEEQDEPAPRRRLAPQAAGFGGGEGSALYRIDPATGEATGVLRDPAPLFDLADGPGGTLLVAAAGFADGPGRVLRVDPITGATAVVAEADSRQATVLLPTDDGVVVGLSNGGAVARLTPAPDDGGTLTSAVLDAGSRATFGTARLDGRLSRGGGLQVRFRSGMTDDPEASEGWNPWTEFADARRFVPTGVEEGRYFQYELKLLPGEEGRSPAVESVRIAYRTSNRRPAVTSVAVEGEATGLTPAEVADAALGSGASLGSVRTVSWEANDPNGDPLTYDVLVRRGRRGAFTPVAEGLTETAYAWDARATGGGVYEVKVVASDARGNPPGEAATGSRVSEPVRVDLAEPIIGDVTFDGETARLRVVDAGGGSVARLEYLVDGDPADAASWSRAFPADGIADSPQEQYSIPLPEDGGLLRLRAVDDAGNVAYQSVRLPSD